MTRRRAGAAGRQAWSFPSDVSRDAPAEPAFVAGDRVRHARFGEGIVVSCEIDGTDQKVTVAFKGEAGIKKLLLSYAPLERVAQ